LHEKTKTTLPVRKYSATADGARAAMGGGGKTKTTKARREVQNMRDKRKIFQKTARPARRTAELASPSPCDQVAASLRRLLVLALRSIYAAEESFIFIPK